MLAIILLIGILWGRKVESVSPTWPNGDVEMRSKSDKVLEGGVRSDICYPLDSVCAMEFSLLG